jgi:hypothetical protein
MAQANIQSIFERFLEKFEFKLKIEFEFEQDLK